MSKRKGERVGMSAVGESGESLRIQERLSLIQDLTPVDPTPATHQEIPLDLIMPDPVQPRRPMPDLLRLEWCKGEPLADLFVEWDDDVRRSLGRVPDWKLWLEGGEVEEIDSPYPAVQLWMELIRLAGNIHQFGLERPITIYKFGGDGRYQILTGERRFLAFNLLHWGGYPGYGRIPAIVRDSYNPYQQAVENGVRENLNAVGVARQLALLLMALNETGTPTVGQADQAWYAQAIELRVPYGKSDQVALMLGLPNERMINRYRALLKLPGVVWNWADEFDWTESKLRQLVQQAQGDDKLLERLAQAEVNRELGDVQRQTVTPRDKAVRKAQGTLKALQRSIRMPDDELATLPAETRQRLVKAAQELIQKLG